MEKLGCNMMRRIIYLVLIAVFAAVFIACTAPSQPPAQQGVQTQQLTQRITDLEKRLKAIEDTSPTTTKSIADIKKDLDEIKLRVNLLETRPIPSGLSPDDRTLLDNLDKRVKALEPTPTPTPAPGATPTPVQTPTPLASAAAVTALERRVNSLEQQVQQLGKQPVSTPAPTQTPAPTPTPTPKPVVDLRVVNHSGEVDRVKNVITMAGEVVNLGNISASSITILATLYKGDGTALGGGTGTPVVTTLAPGQSAPFSFTISNLDLSRYVNKYILRAISNQ